MLKYENFLGKTLQQYRVIVTFNINLYYNNFNIFFFTTDIFIFHVSFKYLRLQIFQIILHVYVKDSNYPVLLTRNLYMTRIKYEHTLIESIANSVFPFTASLHDMTKRLAVFVSMLYHTRVFQY